MYKTTFSVNDVGTSSERIFGQYNNLSYGGPQMVYQQMPQNPYHTVDHPHFQYQNGQMMHEPLTPPATAREHPSHSGFKHFFPSGQMIHTPLSPSIQSGHGEILLILCLGMSSFILTSILSWTRKWLGTYLWILQWTCTWTCTWNVHSDSSWTWSLPKWICGQSHFRVSLHDSNWRWIPLHALNASYSDRDFETLHEVLFCFMLACVFGDKQVVPL